MRRLSQPLLIVLCVTLLLPPPATAISAPDTLKDKFLSPPDSAKPRVWWHWMNGNITQDGIKNDLEWMQRVGVGGVQTFDASFDTPLVVDTPLVYMTEQWKRAFAFAAELADHLNLELAVASSPGWSESGGPWVSPDDAMKKLVWREQRVYGGVPVGRLAAPPNSVGPFQDIPVNRDHLSMEGPSPTTSIPPLYHDIAVLAYRVPIQDKSMSELHPVVTTSGGPIDAETLWDGSLVETVKIPRGDSEHPAWILFDFDHPQIISAVTLSLQNLGVLVGPPFIAARLQASADGNTFSEIATIYDSTNRSSQWIAPAEETVAFSPVSARYFRLLLPSPPPPPATLAKFLNPSPAMHEVAELILHATPRVNHFEEKSGYFLNSGLYDHPTPSVERADAIAPGEIIDLTSRLNADGTLQWTPPPGNWAVLRIGYSLLGVTNHPASSVGTGLEVDKLNRRSVDRYITTYLNTYKTFLGSSLIGSHGLRAMVSDSYEAGPQNWTDDLPTQFATRRGYDPRPWLPTLTGRIVGSAQETDRFLWDFRRTLGELLSESHYAVITAALHSEGMIHYGESHEVSRAFIGDGMDVKHGDDIPMGAMWVPNPLFPQERCDADLRESASVGHLYGQNLIAGESFTAFGIPGTAFAFAPDMLKATADRELLDGLNMFVIHTSVHQPLNNKYPGITLGPFGQWFTRHETWAEQALPWLTYLSRSAYLLQQGHFAADLVYFYGQDSNITALYGTGLPPVPRGYAFDFSSANALNQLEVKDGFLVNQHGMQYRAVVMDPRTRYISLDVLKRLDELITSGATVIGEKPFSTPSLADSLAEFSRLTEKIWGPGTAGVRQYRRGRVISGYPLDAALTAGGIAPDFTYSGGTVDTDVQFVHRHLADGELYFLSNRQPRTERIQARFRIMGRAPELWHADTGEIEPVSFRRDDDQTTIPLTLEPNEAVFVIFRKTTSERQVTIPATTRETVFTFRGPWQVNFPQTGGKHLQVRFLDLHPWNGDANPQIRYFSGTASYGISFRAPTFRHASGERIEIDLGSVKHLAEILVNGHSANIVWKAPYRSDITALLKPDVNQLTIRVTNLWPNRLIGDKQHGAIPTTFTTYNPYDAQSPLLESGLLGPVTLLRRFPTR